MLVRDAVPHLKHTSSLCVSGKQPQFCWNKFWCTFHKMFCKLLEQHTCIHCVNIITRRVSCSLLSHIPLFMLMNIFTVQCGGIHIFLILCFLTEVMQSKVKRGRFCVLTWAPTGPLWTWVSLCVFGECVLSETWDLAQCFQTLDCLGGSAVEVWSCHASGAEQRGELFCCLEFFLLFLIGPFASECVCLREVREVGQWRFLLMLEGAGLT